MSRQWSRRQVLAAGVGSVAVWLATAGGNPHPSAAAVQPEDSIFTLGVASGEPEPEGVVLWTRLARDVAGGGMGDEPVAVAWQVAADAGMQQVVRAGTVVATAGQAHAVHVEVDGLEPGRWYWYQFTALGQASSVGRTKTAPAATDLPSALRFAAASCQNYEDGFFTAYRHMSDEDLDFVVFLGDYIYENNAPRDRPRPRRHNLPPATDLERYRDRYALYKRDPDLQRAHAQFPWLVLWDDHEVENNYAGAVNQQGDGDATFAQRRAAAYQAWYEHMPVRATARPLDGVAPITRRLHFGDVLTLHLLDTRQFRSPQPCGGGLSPLCEQALDAGATLLGADQERWLAEGLAASRARWDVVGQQVMVAAFDFRSGSGQSFNMDAWDGYQAARSRLLDSLALARNPVVLTGDVHECWVSDLPRSFTEPDAPVVASEFVATSISSRGDGIDRNATMQTRLRENPWLRYGNGRRGYLLCTATADQFTVIPRTIDQVTTADGQMSDGPAFVLHDGKRGAARKDEG